MRLGEAKAVARQWVQAHGPEVPGLVGAYLAGSANWLPDDTEFPATSDLDVHLVVEDPGSALKPGKFLYRDVLLEVSYIPHDNVRSAEAALADYHQAGAFRTPSVIFDPTGTLTTLQETVTRQFAQRRWVLARCEHALATVRNYAGSLNGAAPLYDQGTGCAFAAGVTTHVLLVAGLENPTIRKRYAAARALLERYGLLDEYEPLLDLLGCAHLTRERVEQHLVAMTEAFDVARQVIRTSYRFGSDISAAARPISVDGSRELIERGLHREAVFWIVATFGRCFTIFAADAPDQLARFTPAYEALLADLGLASFPDRRQRCDAIVASLPHLRHLAQTIVAAKPAILPD